MLLNLVKRRGGRLPISTAVAARTGAARDARHWEIAKACLYEDRFADLCWLVALHPHLARFDAWRKHTWSARVYEAFNLRLINLYQIMN